ncbi:MAG: hypothetical protein ACI9NC_000396 [Verrucomicrobiales bacterium]|jgi:hypothetical protein
MAYVAHPRYGTAPNIKGLDPNPDTDDVHRHYNTNFFTKSFQGLSELALGHLGGKLDLDALFVFTNRRRTRVKLL